MLQKSDRQQLRKGVWWEAGTVISIIKESLRSAA